MNSGGNSPQVQVEKEPRQRTQHDPTNTNMTKTTANKEDAQDSTAIRRHTNTAAGTEDATDSAAHKAANYFRTTAKMATKEDEADSMVRPSFLNRGGHRSVKEGGSDTNKTMTMTWSTTSTEDYYNMTSNKTPMQRKVPNRIEITEEDLGLCKVFKFMGEDNEQCRQSRPEPGTTFMQTEDHMEQGFYMDASQDYSSVR